MLNKNREGLIALVCFLASVASAAAPVVGYREIFPTGKDFRANGWHFNMNADAVEASGAECWGGGPGTPKNLDPVNSSPSPGWQNWLGFVWISNGQRFVMWTDEYTVDRPVLKVRWMMNMANENDGVHAALRVGNDWYITEKMYRGVDKDRVQVEVDVKGSRWRRFDFRPGGGTGGGNIPQEGFGEMLALPAGNVTAFGLFCPARNSVPSFDTFELVTEGMPTPKDQAKALPKDLPLPAAATKGQDVSDQPPTVKDAQDPYQVHSLTIGGGGWFSGIHLHPQRPGLAYLRSDMCGPWKRDNIDQPWRILYFGDWPDGLANNSMLGIEFHPSEPEIVFADYGASRWNQGLYRSMDDGITWRRIMPLPDGHGVGAGEARLWGGNTIAIDPIATDVIFYGTLKHGVFRSRDAGETWSCVLPLPQGTGEYGARSVIVIPTTQAEGIGFSNIIMASLDNKGLFVSHDGGDSFSEDKGFSALPGVSKRIRVLMQNGAGVVYVGHGNGIARYDSTSGQWLDITPQGGRTCNSISLDPRRPDVVLALVNMPDMSVALMRSEDRGNTWMEPLQMRYGSPNASRGSTNPWKRHHMHPGMGGNNYIALDPHNPSRAYLADCFSLWVCDDVWADKTTWDARDHGVEEIVGITLHCPPSGPALISGVSDVRGFIHHSPYLYPDKYIMADNDWSTYVTGADSCETKPNVMYVAKFKRGKPTMVVVLRSEDAGHTWKYCTEPYMGEIPGAAKIAVSATNPDNVVVLAGHKDGRLKFSRDGGRSWLHSKVSDTGGLMPAGFMDHGDAYNFSSVLAADRVAEGTFYAYRRGSMWVSRDGGESWSHTVELPESNPHDDMSPVTVVSVPSRSGEVWVALGGRGLWRSTDHGKSFSRLPYFRSRPTHVAFGKEVPGNPPETPTVYVWGTAVDDPRRENGPIDVFGAPTAGGQALYRSHDMGATWEKIDEHITSPVFVRFMVADRQTYGRVFINNALADAIYFFEINRTPPEITAPNSVSVTPGQDTVFEVEVKDAESAGIHLWLRPVKVSNPDLLPLHNIVVLDTEGQTRRVLIRTPENKHTGNDNPIELTLHLSDGLYRGSKTLEKKIYLTIKYRHIDTP